MYIGIDVGGTYTDGVLIDGSKVIKSVKIETENNLSISVQQVLAKLLLNQENKNISRVVLSTTLITNMLAGIKKPPVGMLLLPGPGTNPRSQNFCSDYILLKGAVDYRGRIIEEIDFGEVDNAVKYFLDKSITSLVVACKFSQRNPFLENRIEHYIKERYPQVDVAPSNRTSGLLNWIRRANGTAFTLFVKNEYDKFMQRFEETIAEHEINCPVYILKADGGTLPLEIARQYPLESIFSGPAASTFGALATTQQDITGIMLDIGGTTTDIGLILNGIPLMAERGIYVNGYLVPVRALALSSLALGGDSAITHKNGQLGIAPRKGKACYLGGDSLTFTDILVYLEKSKLSSHPKIELALKEISKNIGRTAENIAEEILNQFIARIDEKIEEMFLRWEEEPAYRIFQIISGQETRPQTIICLGGPAQSIGSILAQKRNWRIIVPQHAEIANAIGAALAKTTLKMDVLIDTEQGRYSTNLPGLSGALSSRLLTLDEAKTFALEMFKGKCAEWKLVTADKELEDIEIIYEEGFNIVRNWQTNGKIFQIGLQIKPGLVNLLNEGTDAIE